ncbi:MAG: hypothetical protein IJM06_06665, partial [Firmicutes bacterium]|nr:hypothetical protein [Bacillota bacterium]
MTRKARTLGSILLAVVMIVTLLPAAAFAEEEAPAADGTAVVTGSAEEDEKEENIENPEVIEGEEEKEEEEKEIPLLKGAMLRSGTTYNLWVNGVQVTSANKGNILNATNTDGTPKAEFVPGQNGAAGTLKLNNAVFDGVYNNCGILSKDDLNIELTGKSIIDLSTIDRSAGVHTWVGKTITFTGTGSLETMGKSAGIYNDHGTIKIESGTITAKGVGYGFGVYNLGDWGGAFIINGGSLTAETGYSWGIFNQSG